MKTFITALPLFDRSMTVQAYKLCARNGEKLFGVLEDYREMGEIFLSPGLDLVDMVGIEPFAADKPLFVDMNQYQVLTGKPLNYRQIPPEKLICVLPGKMKPDAQTRRQCEALKEAGYRLASEGIPADVSGPDNMVDLFDYLVLDAGEARFTERVNSSRMYFHREQLVFLNVPNHASFTRLSERNNALFTGAFYSQPITMRNAPITPVKVNALRLLAQLNIEDFDLGDVAKTIERDVSLSLSLLRFINTAAVGMGRRVDSIRNSVAILGQKEVRRWAMVAISLQLAEDKPGELTRLSLVRAKFAESLAGAYEIGMFAPSLFLMGLFSMLDVIMNKPMEEAAQEIRLNEQISQALVQHSGPLYEVLDMILAYERADWDAVSINMIRNEVDAGVVSDAFIKALVWYKELIEDIAHEEELEHTAQH